MYENQLSIFRQKFIDRIQIESRKKSPDARRFINESIELGIQMSLPRHIVFDFLDDEMLELREEMDHVPKKKRFVFADDLLIYWFDIKIPLNI